MVFPLSLLFCHSVLLNYSVTHIDYSSPGFFVMEFPIKGYGSELSFPSPGNLPDLGLKPGSPALQTGSLLSELPGKSTNNYIYIFKKKMLRPNHFFKFSFPYEVSYVTVKCRSAHFSLVNLSFVRGPAENLEE